MAIALDPAGIANLKTPHKSRICQPQESKSEPSKPAKQILHEAQIDSSPIPTDQDSQSAKPTIIGKPAGPDHDSQAVEGPPSAQSACKSKPAQIAQQYSPMHKEASSLPQLAVTTSKHSSEPDSSIKPQPASPQQAAYVS